MPYSDTAIDKYISEGYQVITPYNVGPMGTVAINERVQRQRFPKSTTTPSISFYKKTFFLGDRVIQTKNQKEGLSLTATSNGEIGSIVQIGNNSCEIEFSGRKITFKKYDLKTIELAYAITVHKSQGSEWDKVLFCFPEGAPSFLTKELAYTALTRGKKEIICTGNTYRLFSGELLSHTSESILLLDSSS